MWLSAATDTRASSRIGSSSNSETHESMVQAAHQHFAEGSSSAVYNSDHPTPTRRRPLSSAAARTPRAAPESVSLAAAADQQPLFPEMSPPTEPLDAHMESFPLVPLPLIPRLSLADLRKCEQGLQELLQSLSSSSNDEDAHLAKYASRQLSLVQRHIEQARARERVLQLLSGNLVSAVSTVPPVQRPVSAKALPIFLTPPANPATSSSGQGASSSGHYSSSSSSSFAQLLNNYHSSSRPALLPSPLGNLRVSSAKSPLSKAVAKKKRDAIEAARALIKANLSTSCSSNNKSSNSNSNNNQGVSTFVISAGDHSSSNSNKRRRQLQKKKPTKEEMEKACALQVEKERERRRQEAYQRLIARQELQAEKKKKKLKPKVIVGGSEPVTEEAAPLVSVDDAAQSESRDSVATSSATGGDRATGSNTDAGSENESDESEVSNCSDSDEENEKAIMALEVKVRNSGGDADAAEAEKHDEMRAVQQEKSGDDSDGDDDDKDKDAVSLSGEEIEDAEGRDQQRLPGDAASPPDESSSHDRDYGPEMETPGNQPEVEDEDSEGDDAALRVPTAAEDCEKCERGLFQQQQEEAGARQIEEEQIHLDLQEFMASRKSAMIEQLQYEKQQRQLNERLQRQDTANSKVDNLIAHSESLRASQKSQSDLESARDGRFKLEKMAEIATTGSTPEQLMGAEVDGASLQETCNTPSSAHDDLSITEHFKKPPAAHASPRSAQEPNSKPQQKPGSTTTIRRAGILRAPVTPCKVYRAYFGNFHCILTSVFEQRHAFTSNSLSSSSSSSRDSLVVSHVPVNEQSLRIQLKLYEGWQSIMQDYATVFGNNTVTPRSMLPSSSSSSALSPYTAHYRINSTTRREVCDIVVTALEKLGDWDEHPSGLGLKTTWNLLWTWSKPRVERKTLLTWQKVNHFQHAKALTRKDCLKKNMGKYLAMGGKMKQAYDVAPLTFVLPQEYIAFVQAFQEKGARLKLRDGNGSSTTAMKNIWIMKPVALSRGRGISLINDLSQVVYGEQVVIQEYIANPLLLDGYKFDLRLYVLVTSFNPLEAFFYEEGFVRICTRQYKDSDLTNLFVHLTNSSIQKENQDAIQSSDNPINAAAGEEAGGTKMTLAYLWKRLEAMGADVEKVKTEIIEVILKSLMCGEDHIPFQVNSFDLYGYDILLDETFRPWLIEINSSPSMARENDLDYQVKDALILDTIKLVDPLRFDRAKFVEVVARRLQDLDSEKKRPHAHIRHPKEAEELAMRQLNEDLTEILRGHVPRNFGDLPEYLGSYRRICPHTTSYNQVGELGY